MMKIKTCFNIKSTNGNMLFQYLAAISGYFSITSGGMHYGWPSPSLPQLQNKTHSTMALNADEGSWIAVMPLIGALAGAVIAAFTVDHLGRKKSITLSYFPFFVAWLMIFVAKSAILLFIARFLAGISEGWAYTVVPMYVGEIAEPRIRGFLGSGISVTWILGILLINMIGSYLTIPITALVSSAVPVLGFLLVIWMPESPYFFIMKNNYEDARSALKILRGKLDVEQELNRISNAVRAQTENTGKIVDLFTERSNRKAVLITAVLISVHQLSGSSAITFYTQSIFKEAGDDVSSEVASIIYFSIQLLLTVLCSSVVDRAGRRPLLILSLSGSAMALLCEGTYFLFKTSLDVDTSPLAYFPVVALTGFVISFSIGTQSIPFLILSELFPANVKAFASCLGMVYFSITGMIVSKLFQIVRDALGLYMPFYLFTGSCLLGLIFTVLFLPETKGKTLEEIQQILGGKSGKDVPKDNA